jgi:glycosyltransferase involved in cell wall biosynthesis
MDLKFVQITTFSNSYLKSFYDNRPELRSQPYFQQQKALFCDLPYFFPWRNLDILGYDTSIIVENAEFSQKQWASENQLSFSPNSWKEDILVAQLKKKQPDLLFFDGLPSCSIARIKEELPDLKLIIIYHCSPFRDISRFKGADILLTCLKSMRHEFTSHGIKCFLLRHGFQKSILNQVSQSESSLYDVTFVGQISEYHYQRFRLIKKLSAEIDIDIWGPGIQTSPSYLIKSGIKSFLKGGLNQFMETLDMRINSSIKRRYRGSAYGWQMYQILANSKITINVHGDIAKNEAANVRLFEATGLGTCLVTDWKENLHEMFDLETEVVTYRSIEECVEKVKWLLDHPEERQKIAHAGQIRTLRDHALDKRAIQLNEIIQQSI